jgi:hypothetical protein
MADTKNSATLAAGRVWNADHAAELIGSEYISPSFDIQRLQVHLLARRHRLTPAMAAAVAALAFETQRGRA